MKKHSIALALLAIALVGCTPSNNESNNSTNSKEKLVEEFNNLINSTRFDLTRDSYNLYKDEEKSIVTYTNYPDAKIVDTKDCSFVEGNGVKAKLISSNSSLFVNQSINIKIYIESVKTNRGGNLECILDLKHLINYSNFFISSTFKRIDSESNEKVKTVVAFENNRVKNVSLYANGSVEASLIYNINGYGDSLETKTIDTSGYQELDFDKFMLAEGHVNSYVNGGNGLIAVSRRNSTGYRKQFIKIEREKQIIVGDLYYDDMFSGEPIYLDETVYNGKDKTATYNLAGKEFVFSCDFIPLYPKEKVGVVPLDGIDYPKSSGDKIAYDLENNRILLASANNMVSILDTSKLSALDFALNKEEVQNILVQDNCYHIMTANKAQSGETSGGKIHVIDKKFLNVTDTINLDFVPYNTAVDKRGDIIIIPGGSGWTHAYLYKKATKTVEQIEDQKGILSCSYLSYDKEKDQFVTNQTTASGAVRPHIFTYTDGSYVERVAELPDDKFTDYGAIYFSYKNYIIAGTRLIDVSDWEKPIEYDIVDPSYSYQYSFSFAYNNSIYFVTKENQKSETIIARIDLNDDGFDQKTFVLSELMDNYTFGFVKDDGLLYLYNNTEQALYKYNLNK